MEITYIYLITNIDNNPNKVYVGKTKNPKTRGNNHKRKKGYNNIEYNIIDQVDSLKRIHWKPIETMWIQSFICWGFEIDNNRKEGGGGPEYHTEETKQKMKKPKPQHIKDKIKTTLLGHKQSECTIQKRADKNRGQKRTEETKQKMKKPKLGAGPKKGQMSPDSHKNLWKSVIQHDLEGNVVKEWKSIKEVCFCLNLNKASIVNNLKNRTKSSGGFIWKYK